MLTSEDIQKLIEVFATREEIVTKEDFELLRQAFSDLATAVDAYAKKADDYFQEMVMLSHKVDPGSTNFQFDYGASRRFFKGQSITRCLPRIIRAERG